MRFDLGKSLTFARNDTRVPLHFDEVHPPGRLLDRLRCTLKRETAEVSLQPRPRIEDKLRSVEAARKDSAVHVSLSSDSLFKQPGDLAISTSR